MPEIAEDACRVCGLSYAVPGDDIVYCDGGCDFGYHQSCYDVAEIPEGDFICRSCGGNLDFSKAPFLDDDDERLGAWTSAVAALDGCDDFYKILAVVDRFCYPMISFGYLAEALLTDETTLFFGELETAVKKLLSFQQSTDWRSKFAGKLAMVGGFDDVADWLLDGDHAWTPFERARVLVAVVETALRDDHSKFTDRVKSVIDSTASSRPHDDSLLGVDAERRLYRFVEDDDSGLFLLFRETTPMTTTSEEMFFTNGMEPPLASKADKLYKQRTKDDAKAAEAARMKKKRKKLAVGPPKPFCVRATLPSQRTTSSTFEGLATTLLELSTVAADLSTSTDPDELWLAHVLRDVVAPHCKDARDRAANQAKKKVRAQRRTATAQRELDALFSHGALEPRSKRGARIDYTFKDFDKQIDNATNRTSENAYGPAYTTSTSRRRDRSRPVDDVPDVTKKSRRSASSRRNGATYSQPEVAIPEEDDIPADLPPDDGFNYIQQPVYASSDSDLEPPVDEPTIPSPYPQVNTNLGVVDQQVPTNITNGPTQPLPPPVFYY